ncbi:MAG: tetratricopeptide repeat protein [Bacteroidetes bacterium]|jgi:tetratricopeptide (TPR) repeat protein|nr:tetratricopeptide repeat protein [Bacteroidota bacterium]MDA0973851.1 tetratricopeptide repeat protein [Bacteroidota bacterium]
MKRTLIYLLLLACSLTVSRAQQLDPQTEKATADLAYEQGDLEKAIELYGSLGRAYSSVSVEFNLGNAYFRTNDIPRAILHYERALRMSPGDKDIAHNLELARNLTIDNIDTDANSGITEWWRGKLLMVGEKNWAIFGIVMAFLFAISVALFQLKKGGPSRQLFIPLATLCLILSALLTYFAFATRSAMHARDAAIILVPNVDVLSAPSDGSTDLFVLHEGTKVTIVKEDNGWMNISLPNGLVGWVKAETAEII